MQKYRCVECGEFHEGECDKSAKLAFMMDCGLDALDEYLGLPAESGSRRWMIANNEYPSNEYPAQLKAKLKKISSDDVDLKKIKGFICVCGQYFEYPSYLYWDNGLFYPFRCTCESEYLLYMHTAHLTKRAPDAGDSSQ